MTLQGCKTTQRPARLTCTSLFSRPFYTNTPSIGWKTPRPFQPNTPASLIASEYLVKVLNANVYDVAIETPLTYAANLSNSLGNKVFLKREDTQPVFSFKIRGAINKILSLSDEARAKGVVTCSAGNHAQGVALSSNRLGIEATIVMPQATPRIKVDAVRRLGGERVRVLLHGGTYDEAAAEAQRLVQTQGLTLVHPFDDPHVIAGQGTIGLEVLKGLRSGELHALFACVGGGGLLAGLAAYVKAVRPDVKVIGVEALDAPGMTESLLADKVVTLPSVGLFADGAAVRTVGRETFRVCRSLVDEMITVRTDEICSAIKFAFNDTRCLLEPAGALAVAGLVKYAQQHPHLKGQTLVGVCSGANMDFDRLRFVSERADASETLLSVSIPERPGAFRQLYQLLHPRNVTEFSYRHNNSDRAQVIVSFQTLAGRPAAQDKQEVLRKLGESYRVEDLSDNEVAKAHVRHLAGGRAVGSWGSAAGGEGEVEEVLYRFEFPEAPGALDKFLHTLNHFNQGWSISLFHYRNHGHDYGRVLVGLLVERRDRAAFQTFLDKLAYVYQEETSNSAYTQFLK